MIIQLFPLLCGLAAVCFSCCIGKARQAVYLLAGFFLAAIFIAWGANNPWLPIIVSQEEMAIVVAAVALVLLRRHDWRHFGLSAGGVVAAFWAQTLTVLGAHPVLALLVVAVLLGCGLWAALNRKDFVSDKMLDEALLGVFLLGLLVGLVPAIIGGWQSAGALQSLDTGQAGNGLGVESVFLAIGFGAVGICWSLWRNRRSVM